MTIRLFHHSARSTLHIFCLPCYARINDCLLFSALIMHACVLANDEICYLKTEKQLHHKRIMLRSQRTQLERQETEVPSTDF